MVFTLCAPDGAFLSRVAHPALGILDAATIAELATNPDSARSLAGTGPYRIDHWTPGRERPARAGRRRGLGRRQVPTLVLTWADDPAQRTIGLQSATVDGIDAPGPADLDRIATLPELAVTRATGSRPPTSGSGPAPAWARSPCGAPSPARSIATTLAGDGFAAGSIAATHVTPCEIDGGCGGTDWYELQRPGGERGARGGQVRPGADVPAPRPRPAGARPARSGRARQGRRRAARDQHRAAHRDRHDALRATSRPISSTGKLDGLFLGGVASTLADPGAFLEPLFGADVRSTAADRTPKAAPAIEEAAATADPAARAAAFGRANDAIRDARGPRPAGPPGLRRRVPEPT